MPNEIYHRSNWGNANAEEFGDVYYDHAATNKLYNHSDYYENSDGTDATLKDLNNKASIVLTPTAYSDGSLNTVIPTDGNGDFDFSRGSSATRVNEQGLVEDVQILSGELVQNGDFEEIGSELVTNGNFDTDSDWTLTGATINAGKVNVNSSSPIYIIQNSVATIGKTYRVELTVSDYVSGDLRLRYPFTKSESEFTGNGTYVFYGVAVDARVELQGRFSGQTYDYKIDNVSVKEVGQNWEVENGWSIGNGVALFDSSGNAGYITQSNVLEVGKKYKLTATVNSGIVSLIGHFYDIEQGEQIQTGVDSIFTVKSTNGSLLRLYSHPNDGDAEITDISVVEVTDDTDLPRIDFTDGTGSLLLEPQRTNEIIHSNGFDNSPWQQTAVNVTANAGISPDGTNNAYLIEAQNNTSQHRVRRTGSPPTTVSISIFAKKGTTDYAYFFCGGGSKAIQAIFDLSDGSVTDSVGLNSTLTSASSVSLGNGWYRLQVSGSFTSPPSNRIGIIPYYQSTIVGAPDTGWLGNGESIYIYGGMEENGAYVSSYVPTEFSTVTRSADVANNSGNADLINSTEGVLYAEISGFKDDPSNRYLSINDGTNQNAVYIAIGGNDFLYVGVRSNNTTQYDRFYSRASGFICENNNKIALHYKQNDFFVYLNGNKILEETSGSTPIGMDELAFNYGGSSRFYGNVKCVAVFKEALTDEQLEKLTS